MDFVEWLTNQEFGRQCILSVRDVLSWVNFMNVLVEDKELNSAKEYSHLYISPVMSFIHAACLVYIDGIGSGKVFSAHSIAENMKIYICILLYRMQTKYFGAAWNSSVRSFHFI